MDVCYRCGRRLYTKERCPRCGLTFCEEHLPPDRHDCLAVAEEQGRRRSRLFYALEVAVFLVIAGVILWLVNQR